MPLAQNISTMLVGYLLVMGILGLGLRILSRYPDERGRLARTAGRGVSRGWAGLIRQVVGTAVGGYVLLMIVLVGHYFGIAHLFGVAHLNGRVVASAVTGCAVLVAVVLPVFFIASWLVEWRRRGRGHGAGR
ncbi:DUF6256 family protein [Streptomyces gobiensis]|uniref:DUF6256 family protein n=1 Tax=Streptomyces gobiensis TaxID=2875706 RepID=UPI001E37AD6F|nr:DUF6256 family protein [Streptomyces gobiensis]UGY94473.1 hypothetical protein test1122_23900 [Streptomyces gobiensis]